MKKFLFALTLLVGLAGAVSVQRVTYSGTCALCLVGARGGETRVLGLRMRSWEKVGTEERDRHEGEAPLSPCYAEIWGHPCKHAVKRGGMGQSSWGVIGCGSYADERAFAPRIEAVRALFQLYRRIPDVTLARESYRCIDALLDAGATVRTALEQRYEAAPPGRTRLSALTEMLNMVATPEEWSAANRHAQSGFSGSPPLLADVELLKARLRSTHPETHRAASLALMELPTEERWNFVSMGLDDPDPKIQEAAGGIIIGNHHLDLFRDLLLKRKPGYLNDYLAQSIEDGDVVALLERDDPVTDALCFKAIAHSWRIQFLDQLVRKLNRRDEDGTRRAIGDLLAGPKVFDGETEHWNGIEPLAASSDELRSIIKLGTASKIRDKRKYTFLNACKALAAERRLSDWSILQSAYLEAVGGGVNETFAAVMARAMWEIDRSTTASFLKEEVKLADPHRLTCAFAGMGMLAEREFLDPLLAFQKRIAEAPGPHPNALEHTFQNAYYGQFLKYALHRCRGMHLQKVQRGSDGKLVVAP